MCKKFLLIFYITFYVINYYIFVQVEAATPTSEASQSTNTPSIQSSISNNVKYNSYNNDHQINADELYQTASTLLYSIKGLLSSREKTYTTTNISDDNSDLNIFNIFYKYFSKTIYFIFKINLPQSSPSLEFQNMGKQLATNNIIKELLKVIELLLEKAAFEFGHDDALYTLADMNFASYGKYTYPRNLTAAFNYYQELANRSGNSTAQQMIGFMYATGIDDVVERDQVKALLYHKFAASGHDTAAEMTLAYRYLMGIGVPKSCEDSLFYYKRVADKAIEYYKSGPIGGRQLPPKKIRLYDENGGIYGYGASASSPSKLINQPVWDDILEYYQYMANKGDINAQIGLGQLFYQGTRSISQNFELALKYLKLAANQYWKSSSSSSSGASMLNDPILSYSLSSPTSSPPTTNLEVVQAAGQAAGILGQMYLRGEGVEQNNRTALKWFLRGVKLSNPTALNGLGLMHMNGVEVQKSYENAMNLFKLAAKLDYPDASANLGLIFCTCQLQKGEFKLAYDCFQEAADQSNHLLAVYYLAELSTNGFGTNPSCSTAVTLYKKVVENGDWLYSTFPEAYKAYLSGDKESAFIHYLLASERGYEIAQSNSMWWYLPQINSKINDPVQERLALIYWTRSANQGNIDARVKMGDYYFKGLGTEVDFVKAATCYQIAAEVQFSAMAMWNLGWMYENGIGVFKDFHLAKKWYDRSLATNPDGKTSNNKEKKDDETDNGGNNNSIETIFLSSPHLPIASPSSSLTSTNDNSNPNNDIKHTRKDWDLIGPEGEKLIEKYKAHRYGGDDDDFDESPFSSFATEEEDDDDLLISLDIFIILFCCFFLAWLIYFRQLRNHAINDNNNNIQ
ncbi:9200_t:CDS:10 [Entrophospora sp. SA101]|nr:9200_t:CDS:10 [Entrophospora sp. SA101]